jgi:hypothetical protein
MKNEAQVRREIEEAISNHLKISMMGYPHLETTSVNYTAGYIYELIVMPLLRAPK